MTALQKLTTNLATWHRGFLYAASGLLIVALTVGLYTGYSTKIRMAAVAHTHDVISHIHETVALLRNAESEQRGFLITGSTGYEDAAEEYASELTETLDELEALIVDNESQRERAAELRENIYARLTELRNTAMVNRNATLARLRQEIGDESELRLMAEVRRLHGEMIAEEETLLEQREAAMDSEVRFAAWTIAISGGLALLLGLQAFFIMGRALTSLNREAHLLRAKEKAENADREKSEFLANMSHEIRTPMNSVLGFAELLSGIASTPKQRQYIDAINSSGRAMLSLINDILDLSKIEAGKLELHYQPVSIIRLLREIREVFAPQAEARGLELKIEADPSLPPALIFDQTRLRQILFNVVGNALKFTPQGSITLSAGTRLSGTDETRVTLLITVTDTGIGIAPEHQTRVFEPFRQVEDGPAKGHGGTGLGLSITKRLTDLLNGQVELESVPGEGTTFRFGFPHVEISSATVDPNPTEDAQTNFNHLRPSVILVADDVPLNLELIEGIFEDTHHRLVFARNGHEVLAQAQKHHPDLILLDIRMPDMDGREAFEKLRGMPDFAAVPIVSVTASSMMAEELKLREQFNGYIRKPFSRATLFREVARLLPRHEQSAIDEAADDDASDAPPAPPPEIGPEWPALLTELRRLEAEEWPALSQTATTRETAAFAQDLIERGEAAKCATVVDYGKKLSEQVERFQISAVENTLRSFPQLVSGVASLMGESH
ncbi:ATP-binding protein [Actomonas aquatica]|uniref:histidine kinase n=1 Tax=Actomonas aquatica TaxID=2866162 RepID=A0ABZ1CE65_9BACT|nr:ATP-binding protein [Opitutus sp. WL0086]WRQ89969.1 ATP-binding protein [Opitutus sp. WL0086]